jgi:kinesin family protein C2/C3
MGGGASKGAKVKPASDELPFPDGDKNQEKRGTSANADAAVSSVAEGETGMSETQFESLCKAVFASADADNNGTLDKDEMLTVLMSPTLGLHISNAEAHAIIEEYDADGDAAVSYTEFIPLLRTVMQKVYAAKDDHYNEWAVMEDPESGKKVYMNKRTGNFTSTKPMTFNENRVELAAFDTVEDADGNSYTVRVNDETGKSEYLDWDSGDWVEYGDEQGAGQDTGSDAIIYHDQETVYYPAEINNVFYLNENGEYAFVPCSFLATCRHIQAKIKEIQEYLPDWKDEIQIVMVLQICGYHVPSAMRYANHNGLGKDASQVYAAVNNEQVADLKKELAETKESLTAALADAKGEASKQAERDRKAADTALAEAKRREDNASAMLKDLEKSNAELQGKTAALTAEMTETKQLAQKRQTMVMNMMKDADSSTGSDELINSWAQRKSKKSKALGLTPDPSAGASLIEEEEKKQAAIVAAGGVAGAVDPALMEEADAQIADMAKDAAGKAAQIATLMKDLEASAKEVASLKAAAAAAAAAKENDTLPASMNAVMKLVREYKTLQQSVKQEFTSHISDITPKVKAAMAEAKGLKKGFESESKELVKRYQKEVALRKQYYNTIQELKGNIRVFVRVRKDNRGEYTAGGVFKFPSKTELLIQQIDTTLPPKLLDYARVFDVDSTQELVFEDTKATIMSVIDGYNVCIMAYGQTGSGKTWTMMGPEDNPGVNRRAIVELLTNLDAQKETIDYEITASQMEVYNEGLYDLLSTKPRAETKMKIRQGPDGIQLPELVRRPVATQEDAYKVMSDGDKNRSVMATSMNSASSRSHLLFQLELTTTNKLSKAKTHSTLTLVDLAGSERVAKSEVSGDGLKEAAAINKSLSALGQVFMSLGQGDPHIPYKNSVLTHALSDCLGGNAKCAMFMACSPLESNLPETISTLRFATNIAKIELGPAKKGGKKKKK